MAEPTPQSKWSDEDTFGAKGDQNEAQLPDDDKLQERISRYVTPAGKIRLRGIIAMEDNVLQLAQLVAEQEERFAGMMRQISNRLGVHWTHIQRLEGAEPTADPVAEELGGSETATEV